MLPLSTANLVGNMGLSVWTLEPQRGLWTKEPFPTGCALKKKKKDSLVVGSQKEGGTSMGSPLYCLSRIDRFWKERKKDGRVIPHNPRTNMPMVYSHHE